MHDSVAPELNNRGSDKEHRYISTTAPPPKHVHVCLKERERKKKTSLSESLYALTHTHTHTLSLSSCNQKLNLQSHDIRATED